MLYQRLQSDANIIPPRNCTNASCSHGWLRLMVQSIFAVITVASFILIVRMAIVKLPNTNNEMSRCKLSGCRVECNEAPFYENYEDHIFEALMEVNQELCKHVILVLDNPMFINNTMPANWLSGLRVNIHELTINNGNLMHIQPDAFMSQYIARLRTLVFHHLVIMTWTADSFVGLSNLRQLYIKDCTFVNVPRNPLRAVDDTLENLTITNSQTWNPVNITGITKFTDLAIVDFSFNYFTYLISKKSFTGLQKCIILYLNSCKIYSIGAGSFDNLASIEVLFLQNNFLTVIPANLFKNVVSLDNPKPRINLQNNMWHCDCSFKHLRELITEDILLTDPVCDNPEELNGATFTEFEEYCMKNDSRGLKRQNFTMQKAPVLPNAPESSNGFIYVSKETCVYRHTVAVNPTLKLTSPIYGNECLSQSFNIKGIDTFPYHTRRSMDQSLLDNQWIKFTFFFKTQNYSILQLGASNINNYGVVWYQSTCPHEVYCVGHIPTTLMIYNEDLDANYTFCPILLKSGIILNGNCITHLGVNVDVYKGIQMLHYIITGIACLIFGALCVYALILKNPNLLKGSKRILFVKHKKVDALVLPPKVPLRNDVHLESISNLKENKIFIISSHYSPRAFSRNMSTRSNKSNSPSYISALQPTEDQLAEWRMRHHFNNSLSISSTHSELSTLSWTHSDDGIQYSLDVDNDRTCEGLK